MLSEVTEIMPVELNNRCKICNLIKADEKLWVEVHNKVIKEGLPNSVVCKWLNSMVDMLNADVKSSIPMVKRFNNANFTNHFKNHITSEDEMKIELRKFVSSKPSIDTIAFDDTQQALAGSTISPNNGQDLYDRLSGMVDIMGDNLIAYGENIKKRRDKNPNTPVNPSDVSNYSKFVGDYISAKQNLARMKSAEQSTMMAIESAIMFVVKGLAVKSMAVADEVKSTLEAELKEETSLPDQISKSIKYKLSSGMRELVSEAIDTVKKDYGLK